MDARGTWDGQDPLTGVLAMTFNGAAMETLISSKASSPALYDDGKIGNESAKKKKAFGNEPAIKKPF